MAVVNVLVGGSSSEVCENLLPGVASSLMRQIKIASAMHPVATTDSPATSCLQAWERSESAGRVTALFAGTTLKFSAASRLLGRPPCYIDLTRSGSAPMAT